MVMKTKLEQKIETILPTIHGWCCYEKAAKLANLITENNMQLCVEIGVYGGSSLIPQAMAMADKRSGIVYGIDPWKVEDALEEMIHQDHKDWWGKLDLESIYKHCLHHIESNKLQKYCELIRDKSENVVDKFADNSIDLLHIDGNHSEVLSYKDATLYIPKVKSGGYVMFDDIWWSEVEGVVATRKAILHLLESCDKVCIINNDCMLMRKR